MCYLDVFCSILLSSFYFIGFRLWIYSDYYATSNICMCLVNTAVELKGSRVSVLDGRPHCDIDPSVSDGFLLYSQKT